MPTEIRDIRKKYGLSQRALGRLLGWGEITINRYESGAIQDAAHNDILKFIANSDFLNFKGFSVSISGSNYYHLPYGPIPDDYDLIIGFMIKEKYLKKRRIFFW